MTIVPSTIIPFVRPWEVLFYMELSRAVQERCPEPRPRVRFLTMWKEAADYLRNHTIGDEEVFFVPDFLRTADVRGRADIALAEKEMLQSSGTTIKTMLYAERFLPRRQQDIESFMLRHLSVLLQLIPPRSLVLSNQIDHFCYWLACDIARGRGGAYFGFSTPGRPSLYTQVTKGPSEMWLPRSARTEHYEEADRQFEEIRHGVPPSYMKPQAAYPGLRKKIAVFASRVREYSSGSYFISPRNFAAPVTDFMSKIRWAATQKGVKHTRIEDIEGPFVYLPLHFEPESATYVYAPQFRNQEQFIHWVAQALPVGVKLVIKENPGMWGRRPLEFYQTATRHPETVWVRPETPSRDLIARCHAVATIAGTSALEAVAMGKPAIVLGDPPFVGVIRSVRKVRSPAEMGVAIVEALRGKTTVDDKVFRDDFARYIANLVPRPYLWAKEVDGLASRNIEYGEEYADYVVECLEL